MTQMTAAARPAKTARHVAKIREMRKVRGAIKWHERAREKRQKIIKERHEDKRTFAEVRKWRQENVVRPIKEAKKNLKEDYEMGPLRPNRAVGSGADKYGVMGMEQLRRPPINVDTWRRKNEAREAKGFEPEYPLVVDDKKYFPIAAQDRVMVMKGREQGKIGVVTDVLEASHEVILLDINKHYADGSIFNTPEGEAPVSKRAIAVPLPIDDVRLVVPYRMTTQNEDGKHVHTWSDVVVDNIAMERHTTGKDPFTGVYYGTQEFPEEHRFDPETGLPVFNRYIAGTRTRIQWPWETTLPEEEEATRVPEEKQDNLSLVGKLKSPVKFLRSKLGKNKEANKPEEAPKTPEQLEEEKLQSKLKQLNKVPETPRGAPVKFSPNYPDDTGRNKAEPSPHTSSFYPTLVYPPYPSGITSEIQQHTQQTDLKERNEKQDWYEDAKEVSSEERAERKAAKAEKTRRKVVPDSMKTPLQLRWEVERKNKLAAAETTKVDREALLIALGQHMEATRAAKKGVRSPTTKPEAVAELD
ncbi:hypothetical protein P171DRAFT_523662 [Karstenula rhodostoma CBS 690.94]|uniref:KOW domain-containing protein n=1 Tax=Karstenula rhodostoma CBS 690.94 TaxID=1392251 RepID=A0A9P4PES7_9PLEO|nr:hypothetical protein P171DRAFT_523662 [Karstenula rhodostoma CBS 690.94]